MDKIKKILNEKPEYANFILGVEYIIRTAMSQPGEKNFTIEFPAKSSFHRMLIHTIAIVYRLDHCSYVKDSRNDISDYYWYEEYASDIDCWCKTLHCSEFCHNKEFILKKRVGVRGRAGLYGPKQSIVEYWKTIKPNNLSGKYLDKERERDCCDSFDVSMLDFKTPIDYKLPTHYHT